MLEIQKSLFRLQRLQRDDEMKWQDRWDMDKNGRKYHSLQKSINSQGVNRSNRREEGVLTKLRFDTALNKTLF